MVGQYFWFGLHGFNAAGNLMCAVVTGGPVNALLMLPCGLALAWTIRGVLAEERASALRFQRLVTESGGSLHACDFPALHAALKRHGAGLDGFEGGRA